MWRRCRFEVARCCFNGVQLKQAEGLRTSSSPFKGEVGWGMGFNGTSYGIETHPHPNPPLEGEGVSS
jgi:hypothetical protein